MNTLQERFAKQVIESVKTVIRILFDSSDTALMSREAQEMLSHPTDKIIFRDAVNRLKNGEKSVTIITETQGEITIF